MRRLLRLILVFCFFIGTLVGLVTLVIIVVIPNLAQVDLNILALVNRGDVDNRG